MNIAQKLHRIEERIMPTEKDTNPKNERKKIKTDARKKTVELFNPTTFRNATQIMENRLLN